MAELIVMNCETISFIDKEGNKKVFYRLWFNLPSGFGWLTSNKKYDIGSTCPVEIYSQSTQDTKTNFRLGLRVAST